MFRPSPISSSYHKLLLWTLAAPAAMTLSMALEQSPELWAQTNALEGAEIPATLPDGTTLLVSSSEAMRLVNHALPSRFAQQYEGTQVEVTYQSADEAVQALINAPPDEDVEPAATLDEVNERTPGAADRTRGIPWWPWILALPILGGLLWWLLKDRTPAAVPLGVAEPEPACPSPVPNQSIEVGAAARAAGLAAAGLTTAKSRPATPAPVAPTSQPGDLRDNATAGIWSDQGAESRITLVPRSADSAHAHWEVAPIHRQTLKHQGGQTMALRIHDATNLELDHQPAHSTQEYLCQETDQDRHVPIPTPDRDYVAELGYLTEDGQWLRLLRSRHVRIG